MQRRADGLRNWRLTKPDDRGPGQVKVQALLAQRSTVHLVNDALQIDIHATATPLPAEQAGALPDNPLRTQLRFSGRYRGQAFVIDALTSDELSFQETGRSFSLRGQLDSGTTHLEAVGSAADVFKFAGIDAQLDLSGPSLAQLGPFFNISVPATRPYRLSAKLHKTATDYAFTELHAEIGATDLAGELNLDVSNERAMLHTSLQSQVLHVDDLGLWHDHEAAAKPDAAPTSAQDAPEPSARRFSAHAWPLARLQDLDAQVELKIKQLHVPKLSAVQSLQLSAGLDDGVLDITPLTLGLADGHAEGSLVIDAREGLPAVRTKLEWRDLDLDQLLPELPEKTQMAGKVQGQARLSGRGDSLAAVLGSAVGSLGVSLRDANISNKLDAKMGLNGGKLLRALVSSERQVALRCASLTLDFRNGIGKSRRLLIDTEETHIEGSGSLNLKDETFDLLLLPQPKQPGLLSLRKSIRVKGTLRDADYALAEREEPSRASGCGP
ncbi:MAG TPA: AsmA family protein [Rhizobacter sp.]|nr:AsmA family protein [Rhizobacter sp.]